MKVKCIANKLTNKQISEIGTGYYKNVDYHITIGKTYDIYGLTFSCNEQFKGCLIHLMTDYGNLVSTPLLLFEIIDGSVSKYWEFRVLKSGGYAFWPTSFYTRYYLDDLSEGVPEILEDFKQIKENIEKENLGMGKSSESEQC